MTLLPLFQPRWHRRTFWKTFKKNEADLTRSFSWNYACKKSFEILDPRRFVCEVSFPFSYRCIPTWGHHSKVVVITICSVKSMSIGLVADNAWVEFLIDQYNHSWWDFRRWNAMYNVIEYIENQIYFKGKKLEYHTIALKIYSVYGDCTENLFTQCKKYFLSQGSNMWNFVQKNYAFYRKWCSFVRI